MTCHCGCNQPARRNFLPGHDQRLRANLERQVGGLLNLQQLVDLSKALLQNDINPDDFISSVHPLFPKS